MVNSLRYKKSHVLIIFLFFGFMLFFYGRGTGFDVESAEKRLSEVKVSSKAPFLLSSLLLLVFLNKRKFQFSNVVNIKLWIIYFWILFVLCFFREDIAGSFYNFFTIVISFLVFFQLLQFVYTIPFRKLEVMFTYISFSITLLCVYVHVLQGNKIVFFPDRTVDNLNRLGGVFYYAHTAMIVGIATLFSFKLYLSTRKLRFLLISFISLILLIATDCRSAWFGVFFSLVFLIFFNIKFFKIFILSVLAYLLSAFQSQFFSNSTSMASTESDSMFRVMIWSFSWDLLIKKLFVGYGGINPFSISKNTIDERLDSPHNALLGLGLQSGIIAASFYLTIFISNTSKCINSYDKSYRFLFFYWLFVPFFWGGIYEHLSSFIGFYMFFTIYGFALNHNSERAEREYKNA